MSSNLRVESLQYLVHAMKRYPKSIPMIFQYLKSKVKKIYGKGKYQETLIKIYRDILEEVICRYHCYFTSRTRKKSYEKGSPEEQDGNRFLENTNLNPMEESLHDVNDLLSILFQMIDVKNEKIITRFAAPRHSPFSFKTMEYIFENCSHSLEMISLYKNDYLIHDDEVLLHFFENKGSKWNDLKRLDLSYIENVTTYSLESMFSNTEFQSLEELDLGETGMCLSVTDKLIQSMPLKNITSISINFQKEITDEGLKMIFRNAPKLKRLNINTCSKITGQGLKEAINQPGVSKALEYIQCMECRGILQRDLQDINKEVEFCYRECIPLMDDAEKLKIQNRKKIEARLKKMKDILDSENVQKESNMTGDDSKPFSWSNLEDTDEPEFLWKSEGKPDDPMKEYCEGENNWMIHMLENSKKDPKDEESWEV